MASLSHWDFAAQFSGNESAALVLGLEPRESTINESRISVVIDRMALHYSHAIKRHYHEVFQIEPADSQGMETAFPFELESVKLNELRHQCDLNDDATPFTVWLASNQSQFDAQFFSRNVVAGWLNANGLKSIYEFTLDQRSGVNDVTGHWPWGDHHTVFLGHLEAAAMRYWVNYDPTDATSAPINKDVSEWLITERKVSQKMAESIASMLRPDGLATGPRK